MGLSARLLVYSESEEEHLELLLQGVAASLRMQYCSIPLLDEPEGSCSQSLQGIWVIGVSEIRQDHVVWIKRLSYQSALPVVLVADALPPNRISEILRSGAVACLSTSDAFQQLPSILKNLVRCLSRYEEALPVVDDVILILPSLTITNGKYNIQLPPTLGRLLACLARNPGSLVPHDRLIQEAWGRSDGATVKTLHQHIHNLRRTLTDFGIDPIIRVIRGSGYMLAKSETHAR